jgi:hypothetical protein
MDARVITKMSGVELTLEGEMVVESERLTTTTTKTRKE